MTDETSTPSGAAASTADASTAEAEARARSSLGVTVEPSGVIAERAILQTVDTEHPAIDSAPRRSLPAESTRIDLNDPILTGAELAEARSRADG